MIDILLFAWNSILTTILTITFLVIISVVFVYLISVFILVKWSISTGIFKNSFMWFNPLKLIEYSGCNTTIHTDVGSYVIYYQSILPKTRFISNNT